MARKPRPSELAKRRKAEAKVAEGIVEARTVHMTMHPGALTFAEQFQPVPETSEMQGVTTIPPTKELKQFTVTKREPIATYDIAAQVKALGADSLLPKTMARSSQHKSGIAKGTHVRGGGKQVTITLTEFQLDFCSGLALKKNISVSEQIRQFIQEASK